MTDCETPEYRAWRAANADADALERERLERAIADAADLLEAAQDALREWDTNRTEGK